MLMCMCLSMFMCACLFMCYVSVPGMCCYVKLCLSVGVWCVSVFMRIYLYCVVVFVVWCLLWSGVVCCGVLLLCCVVLCCGVFVCLDLLGMFGLIGIFCVALCGVVCVVCGVMCRDIVVYGIVLSWIGVCCGVLSCMVFVLS